MIAFTLPPAALAFVDGSITPLLHFSDYLCLQGTLYHLNQKPLPTLGNPNPRAFYQPWFLVLAPVKFGYPGFDRLRNFT